MLIQHVCGASGFNPMYGDECPGCEAERAHRQQQVHARLRRVFEEFEGQLAIARLAQCSIPDVREFLADMNYGKQGTEEQKPGGGKGTSG